MLIHAAASALLLATAAAPKPAALDTPSAPPAETPAVAAPASPDRPAAPVARTLWLVQSLYPGQEALVARTEGALARLFGEGGAATDVVGRSQLATQRPDSVAVETCLFGDSPCADPVGALVAAYGLDRVVLIKAGQDDAGYRFRVASFQPGTVDAATAESANAALETALMGAVIKVAPLASTLDIVTDPPGATVLVDGERVGTTPLSTQALPGERTFRLELATFHPVEWQAQVPVRGRLQIERTLEQMPATLLVSSAGATILVDGKEAGRDTAEVGVAAGTHRVQLVRDGHEPWETTVEVKAGEQLRVERELNQTGWHSFTSALSAEQEAIYARESYFSLSFDSFTLVDDRLAARALKLDSKKTSQAAAGTALWGISAEYGTLGRYFGLMTIGGSYFQSASNFELGVAGRDPAVVNAQVTGGSLRLLHPQLRVALWRFVLGVQGGFVGRLAHVNTNDDPYSSGFLLADVGVDVQGGLKLFVVDGLYLEGAYQHSFTLAGSTDGMQTFRGGFGYAF